MGVISSSEIKAVYTTLIAAKYDELLTIKATSFLRSFFPDNITKVRYPAYDVRRGSEKVAIDVILGHQGVRTQLTKATQKIADLFYYRYFFDATELDCYWNLFGSTSISENVMTEFVDGIAQANKMNQDLIERAYELLCASVLEYGTCTFNDGTILNFNRKAGSMVDINTLTGSYWDATGHDPYADIQAAGDFIRQYGKGANDGFLNVMLGSGAFNALINNSVVKERNDIKMWKLDDIVSPDRKIEGQTYHGTMSCGPYVAHLWQYPQFYDNASNVSTPYLNPKKFNVLPNNPDFQTIYGATPQLVTPGAATASLTAGKYILSEYIDLKSRSHEFHIESRGIPVPLSVDKMYTGQVIA